MSSHGCAASLRRPRNYTRILPMPFGRAARRSIWTKQDLNSANGRHGTFDEVDFDAGYDRSLEIVSFSAGAIRYA